MDVSDECSIEGDPTEDLASFEVVDLSNHGLLDLSEELNGHERKEKAKLKTKLISAWNNVKYGGWTLKTKSHLRKSSPLYVLGQSYQLSYSGERECLRRAFSSLLWLTYRRGFPPLDGSALTSDAGWGCMLRSAQMLLAQGLMLHMMPTGWTWPATHHQTKDDLEVVDPRVLDDLFRENRSVSGKPHRRSLDTMLDSKIHEDRTHRKLVSWFGDLPSAPFGLHRLVDLGKASGKRAGDWYGPSIAAHILQKAVAASEVSNLVVYVAQDCTDDQLIYLDPHYCQSAVDITQDNFPLESFHCKTVRKMSFNHMDPSCTLGFYASSRADFQNLYSDVTTALTSSEEKYPIFTFVDGHDKGERVFSSASVSHINTKDRRSRTKQRNNTEEFVLL
ncbi:cysteine protease atg4da-like isoform X2 [Myxocyprinus asiaticus]|uniref:cysteine protease atg4da-like isoform X2 n=1 Tax=Myxocyprinus asiaticus TaxID=70543 RepID=UPI002221DD75|nr:cysteine protease atg4da-like isoform X2 [Myxocyprinus asiaticus]